MHILNLSFASQAYASHLLAFEAPLAALAVDRLSVRAAFAVWAALALAAVAWVTIVARGRFEPQRVDQIEMFSPSITHRA